MRVRVSRERDEVGSEPVELQPVALQGRQDAQGVFQVSGRPAADERQPSSAVWQAVLSMSGILRKPRLNQPLIGVRDLQFPPP